MTDYRKSEIVEPSLQKSNGNGQAEYGPMVKPTKHSKYRNSFDFGDDTPSNDYRYFDRGPEQSDR